MVTKQELEFYEKKFKKLEEVSKVRERVRNKVLNREKLNDEERIFIGISLLGMGIDIACVKHLTFSILMEMGVSKDAKAEDALLSIVAYSSDETLRVAFLFLDRVLSELIEKKLKKEKSNE